MSTTHYMEYLLPLILLLLPTPTLSLYCSQCQEITVDGQYYDDGPRDCLNPTPVLCSPGEDRCISAGVTFQLLGEQSSTIDFGIKYCGNRHVTCEQIEEEMKEGVDYGTMDGFTCHIGTKCEADLCNRLVPVVRPESYYTLTTPGSSSTSFTEDNNNVEYELELNEVEVDIEVARKSDNVEGNEQAVKSGQSKDFTQSSMISLILCGLILLQF